MVTSEEVQRLWKIADELYAQCAEDGSRDIHAQSRLEKRAERAEAKWLKAKEEFEREAQR